VKKIKLYFDTSVIGGYYDKEFENETQLIFKDVIENKYALSISDLTIRELIKAPDNVRNLLKDKQISHSILLVNDEVLDLAKEYIRENVVGETSFEDCIHIALATVNEIDILVSWNFKHIVNINRIRGYNAINIKNGYSHLEIRSPKDIIEYEDK
jgi:predicted nucleic acid-binding protein